MTDPSLAELRKARRKLLEKFGGMAAILAESERIDNERQAQANQPSPHTALILPSRRAETVAGRMRRMERLFVDANVRRVRQARKRLATGRAKA